MHPLPSVHLRLRPCLIGANPIPPLKQISSSLSHRLLPRGEDTCLHTPLIYWRAVALTGVVCFILMSAGIVLAVGSGKRPVTLTEERIDEAPSPVAVDLDAGDSSCVVNAPAANPLDDDVNVAPLTEPILMVASTPLTAVTPLNPEPLDPFADPSGDNPALAQRLMPAKTPPACKRYGTAVDFIDNPIDAAAQALRERKLLFVLHVAGNFEEEKFT